MDMLIAERKMALDEFHAFQELPENRNRLFEFIDGEIVEKMGSFKPARIGGDMLRHLLNWLDNNPIGRVSGADGSYILPNGDEVMPDVGYISKARMPEEPPRQALMAPDLAVEVKSPNDSIPELRRKATLYLEQGTQLVWLVFPETRRVEVYTPDGQIIDVGIDGTLDGGAVLPGFTLAVRKLLAEA
jgi:Uma2 family endonuclease